MQAPEPINDYSSSAVPPLPRRLSLRIRCARPELILGKDQKTKTLKTQLCSELMRWQRAARFWRTLVVVKRPLVGPSSLAVC